VSQKAFMRTIHGAHPSGQPKAVQLSSLLSCAGEI
jgi:hypothetical protein